MKDPVVPRGRQMRAVMTNPNDIPRLIIQNVPFPVQAADQALIKVKAFSLNQGETRTAMDTMEMYTPGWDFAGVVEQAASDGSTLKAGTRVFGYIPRGSWSEYLVAPAGLMAEIPGGISSVQAAAIPIAGLTAMACLDASGDLFGRKVLITGAAGGVGRFACQMATLAGAKVYAVSRRPKLLQQLQKDGVEPTKVFANISEAVTSGTYDVIWDSLGGDSLALALKGLSRNGLCVNFGNSSRQPTTFNVRHSDWPFHGIRCIWLGREPVADNRPFLNRLATMVNQGQLHTSIDKVVSWANVAEAAEELIQQGIQGKVVLKVQ
jgi:NADPH2:quinone reductase